MKHKDGNLVKLEPVELEFLFHCQASRSVIRSIFFSKRNGLFLHQMGEADRDDGESSEAISAEEGSDAV